MRASALLLALAATGAAAVQPNVVKPLPTLADPFTSAVNAAAAFTNLKFPGKKINASDATPPFNATIVCNLDPATRTVAGVVAAGFPPLCATTTTKQGLVVTAPITAVTVGMQPDGPGVASLRFTTASGDLFCGYATKKVLAKAVTAAVKGSSFAGFDPASTCAPPAAGKPAGLTAGGLGVVFTTSGAATFSSGLAAGAGTVLVFNPATATFEPRTLQADGGSGPGGVSVGAGDAGAPAPGVAAGAPDPAAPAPAPAGVGETPPSDPADPVAQDAAVSWSESVVAGDPDLAAAVAATDAAGFASPDNMPPPLGEAYAADNIMTDMPPVPMSAAAAAGLAAAAVTSSGSGGAGASAPYAGDDASAAPVPVPATPSAPRDEDVAAVAAATAALREQIAGDDPALAAPPAPGVGEPAAAPADVNATSLGTGAIGYANGAAGVAYDDARVPGYLDGTRKTGQLYVCRAVSGSTCVSWSFCTASLIGNSLLLTAAHCIFSYGAQGGGWPKFIGGQLQVYFYPGVQGNVAPYGYWAAQDVTVPASYYYGTDTCLRSARGVVCNNDVALIWLKPGGNTNPPQQAGARLGYNAYGFNNYGMVAPSTLGGVTSQTFATTFGSVPTAAVTQLGYPVAFDAGNSMQIGNSATARYYLPGSVSTTGAPVLNIMRGSSMAGGSSGGPWIVNYGPPASGGDYGANAARDVIVGVTSWGFSDGSIKTSAASVFGQNAEYSGTYGARGAGNIAFLVNWACDRADAPWKLQSKGMCTASPTAGVGK